MKRHPSVLFGLLLVGIGALLLLQQTGAIDEDVGLGPLILMVVGGWLFLARLSAGSRWGNAGGYVVPLVLFGIGLVLFLRDTGAIGEDVDVWPVILIAIGVGVVLGALPTRRGDEGTARSERVAVPLQGASEARVVIKHGAGELRVRSGAAVGSVGGGRFGGAGHHPVVAQRPIGPQSPAALTERSLFSTASIRAALSRDERTGIAEMMSLTLLLMTLGVQAPAPDAPAAATQAETPAAAPGDKRICRRIAATGSLIRKQRECRTRAEWDLLASAARKNGEQMQQDNSGRPAGL